MAAWSSFCGEWQISPFSCVREHATTTLCHAAELASRFLARHGGEKASSDAGTLLSGNTMLQGGNIRPTTTP
jgi:hypothetical protein